jgi:hypothetical protein
MARRGERYTTARVIGMRCVCRWRPLLVLRRRALPVCVSRSWSREAAYRSRVAYLGWASAQLGLTHAPVLLNLVAGLLLRLSHLGLALCRDDRWRRRTGRHVRVSMTPCAAATTPRAFSFCNEVASAAQRTLARRVDDCRRLLLSLLQCRNLGGATLACSHLAPGNVQATRLPRRRQYSALKEAGARGHPATQAVGVPLACGLVRRAQAGGLHSCANARDFATSRHANDSRAGPTSAAVGSAHHTVSRRASACSRSQRGELGRR